ncbi:gamma tubulin complex Spc97/GCP2 subunit Alp4 [Tilletia horrida]|uniref:Gamma tubulin complex Spc97/GCP2 subunit Alp4 n=1 Tax=Tilletia horrida TaxID=155126 RepID=A0AAN6GQA2_9BASI|nr:gamma tubulin complex Spc97/GCP2 subunit Alp4 [Tilletia horrida]KAK0552954.1 gamma tubulin complex Spc97/GCP2 subunit Alp4 [Tilletia horrida]KAK0559969.1 gamma tubulin complex Spc97/GCP2 subunit Alp4 [Tilletia horrida]
MAAPAAAPPPPETPIARSARTSSRNIQLSESKLRKYSRNVALLQQSTRKARATTTTNTAIGTLSEAEDEDQQAAGAAASSSATATRTRTRSSNLDFDLDRGAIATAEAADLIEERLFGTLTATTHVVSDRFNLPIGQLLSRGGAATASTVPSGTSHAAASAISAIVAGTGGADLAYGRAAYRRGGSAGSGILQQHTPDDSFIPESSFVHNPLNRRIPAPSPRAKQTWKGTRAAQLGGGGGGKGKRAAGAAAEGAASAAKPSEMDRDPTITVGTSSSDKGKAAESGGARSKGGPPHTDVLPLPANDIEMQEALILEDILFVLMGIEGQYIHYSSSYDPANPAHRLRGAAFTIDSALDPSLRKLTERVLVLATFYTSVFAFVELESSLEYGTVIHALCAAIREQLKDYETLVVQLEHQLETSPGFTLQKLWFYVHPTIRTLSLIHAITSYIASITHADILEDDEDDSSDEEDDDEDDEFEDDDEDDAVEGGGGSTSEGEGSLLSGSEAERKKRKRRRKRQRQRERDELADDQSLERERRALLGLDEEEDVGPVGGGGGGGGGRGMGEGRQARLQGGIVRGGEVLTLLWDRMEKMSGDPTAHSLYATLFLHASQPYARTLLLWITTGHLSDTYSEFMVMEDARVTRASLESDPTDEYWERRYTLRDETVLANLERRKAYAALEAQAQAAGEEEIEAAAAVEGEWDEDLGLGLGAGAFALQQQQQQQQQLQGGRGIFTGGAKIPGFLQPWKQKILLAGKYLNVIRECGIEVMGGSRGVKTPLAGGMKKGGAGEGGDDDEDEDSEDVANMSAVVNGTLIWPVGIKGGLDAFSPDEDELIEMHTDEFFHRIESAYQRANEALLRMLLNDQHIVARLRSLKHYFFLSQSDYFSSFLEQAKAELRKYVIPQKLRETTTTRLQTHLGMVLGSSSCVGFEDPYREDIRIEIAMEGAYDQLQRIAETKGGLEAAKAQAEKKRAAKKQQEQYRLLELLQFDIAVKFPVSLIISKKNILRWQFVQRCIVHLKVSERQLAEVWLEHQEDVWREKSPRIHPDLDKWKTRVFQLRHRMMFFVQQVLAFVCFEVIEPNWREFEAKMAKVQTVDQLMRDHLGFLNTCRNECMLTDYRYLRFLRQLMRAIAVFCESRREFHDQLMKERMVMREHEISERAGDRLKLADGVEGYIGKIEDSWERNFKVFRDVVTLLSTTDNPAALPLSYRLQSAMV